MVGLLHRRIVTTVGEHMKDRAHFPQLVCQDIHRTLSKPSYGADADGAQFSAGSRPHIEKVLHRQRIDDLLVIVRLDPGNGIRLLVVAAQLRRDLVV